MYLGGDFYRFDFFNPTQLLVWMPAASRIMHPVPRAWQQVAIGGFLWTVWCSVLYMAEMRPLGTGDRLIYSFAVLNICAVLKISAATENPLVAL